MDTNGLTTIVALLAALSVASERLAEVIKGVVPFLNLENKDPRKEGLRRALLQTLAAVSGVITALLAAPGLRGVLSEAWTGSWGLIALGLLASGGSGFWNGVLSYVKEAKDLKKQEVIERKRRAGE